ncbi:MAG: glutamine-hydrolyzing GMP synthase [SAR324 cluster bacterium]|nr:glutamine-hydrolyzing GMP synthase [SAR324 cluster bacterium]
MHKEIIAVLDFGSQYAHLIAKRIRHLGVYTEIFSPSVDISKLEHAKGVILSGGPASVFAENIPAFNPEILSMKLPLLGLCYGHQLIGQQFGGTISNTGKGEFGKTQLELAGESPILAGVPHSSQVWMSHQDSVTIVPADFRVIARTVQCPVAGMQHKALPIFTFQFHPEVKDSVWGTAILNNFINICEIQGNWSMQQFVDEAIMEIRRIVKDRQVLMFLSGGVDSSVAFALLNHALGHEKVLGLLIDNGFLRKNEAQKIMHRYHQCGFENIRLSDSSEMFLKQIGKLVDPQEKRKSVGTTFIQIRDQFVQELGLEGANWLLGQGTLYPDIIESGGTEHSEVIKYHHNRVQAVQDLIQQGLVIEPLKELYKDEVRQVGALLGLPDELVWRHPFPGPGLSINVLCSTGNETLLSASAVEQLKAVVPDSFESGILPVKSVGVQGDQRTYTHPAVLIGPRDWDLLEQVSTTITNSLRAVNRVVTLLYPETLPDLKIHEAYCTSDRLDLLREADDLATRALKQAGLMREVFQLLVILLPIASGNTGECIVLRPVCSEDVMTAQFAKIAWDVVLPLAHEIGKIAGIEAVFYDVTHKPPATFGWE